METEELVKVLYRIPASDRRALRIAAARQEINSTELVRRLIRQYLAEQKTDQES